MLGIMKKASICLAIAVNVVPIALCQSQTMEFELQSDRERCPNCVWLQATGLISSQTPRDFDEALDIYPFVDEIHLDSSGGNLAAAIEMGLSIREKGLNTKVAGSRADEEDNIFQKIPGHCHSACVFLLAGGVSRSEEQNSSIGLHQFSGPLDEIAQYDAFSLAQQTSGVIVSYLDEMGISPRVAAIASSVDPTSIYELSTREKYDLDLLNDNQWPQQAELTEDPFGDAERQAPIYLLTKCDEPRYAPGNYSVRKAQQLNRAFRELCIAYTSKMKENNLATPCQPAWDWMLDTVARMEQYPDISGYLALPPGSAQLVTLKVSNCALERDQMLQKHLRE
ncbi:hypothetical protein [Henriciella pelagia]|uniref:Uncharacterized protein n=1 Tax=Henriciella pelagia TaxID=1977912 RepID=A0ABQ1JML7_9PROT|nr:hypothetical protein [Henriciella pelagia]GGB70022.1 hypothetical protein GCM10011503_18380 [Henriciella pelagia]